MKRFASLTPTLIQCLALVSVLALTVYGCGRSVNNSVQTNGNKSGDPVPVAPPALPVDYREALRKLKQVQVTCPTGDCQPSVGMIAAMDGQNGAFLIRRCTGFLIDSQTAVTAAHCIPPEVLSGQTSCSERVQIAFPDVQNHAAERGLCLKVLSASISEAGVDYAGKDIAVLRLAEALQRPASTLSQNGLEEGAEAQIQGVKAAAANDTDGEVRTFKLLVAQNTLVLPQFDSASTPAATLAGSTVEALETATAGAPVFVDQKIRAIFTRTSGLSTGITSSSWSHLISPSIQKNKLAIATSFACATGAGLSPHSLSPDCNRDLSLNATRALWEMKHWLNASTLRRAEEMMKQTIAHWVGADSSILRWDLLTQETFYSDPSRPTRFTAVPVCFSNLETWLNRYATHNGYKKKAQVAVVFPKWQFQFFFNSKFQLEAKVSTHARPLSTAIEFSPADLKDHGKSRVLIDYRDSAPFDADLRTCP